MKTSGIVQGFWSLNPNPLDDDGDSIRHTPNNGFYRFDKIEDFKSNIESLFLQDLNFFSSMRNKEALGQIIEEANQKTTYEAKAEEFLKLLKYE